MCIINQVRSSSSLAANDCITQQFVTLANYLQESEKKEIEHMTEERKETQHMRTQVCMYSAVVEMTACPLVSGPSVRRGAGARGCRQCCLVLHTEA